MTTASEGPAHGTANPDPGGLTVTIHDDHVDLVMTGGERHTMPVGPLTICAVEFELRDPPPPACLTNALGTVHDHLDDILIESPIIAAAPSVVFVGHHADALAQVEFGDHATPSPHLATRADIDEVFRTLVAESTIDRLANPGLDTDHAGTIIATCCVVLAIMRRLALGEARFAPVRTSPTSTRSQEGGS
jgi:exopolyphosphatase/pppGpp-phosphohydrolase